MKTVDSLLIETSDFIDKHLNLINSDNRAEESTEILFKIRNFTELVMYKIYNDEKNTDLYQTHDNLVVVRKFIKEFAPNINRYHQILEASGHVTFGLEQSEALMIKYIPYLIEMKLFIFQKYKLILLKSIDKYPLKMDDSLIKFYKKILKAFNDIDIDYISKCKGLYYINKKTMKYIDNQVLYEYVLNVSDDITNKFNTIVAYSKFNINFNYDMIFFMCRKTINFLDTNISINIICDYEIFIRPCAFNKLSYMLNFEIEIKSRTQTYHDLMTFIQNNNYTLLDIAENNYSFTDKSDAYTLFMKKMNEFMNSTSIAKNLIKYLLLNMRYNVVKGQLNLHLYKEKTTRKNPYFDNLVIGSASLGFCYNPIAFSPQIERPSLYDLSRIVDFNKYEHEFLYRKIEKYINKNNSLFVSCDDLGYKKEEIDKLVEKFNKYLYSYYSNYRIEKVFDKYTIKFYYETSIKVLKIISSLSSKCNQKMNYPLQYNEVLSSDKIEILNNAFKETSICVVTGSAGTGKTKLIHEFLKINADKKTLCITTTNTAKNNLKVFFKNKITYKNTSENFCDFGSYEFVVIDEAEFVSTEKMHGILEKNPFANYLIVGDPYQIESIEFGNWFKLVLTLFKEKRFIYSLVKNHRTDNAALQKVWDEVRNVGLGDCDNKILELFSTFKFARTISKEAFTISEDQVVLCLNYDGLYGINNLNRYLQTTNPCKEYIYQQNIYKINDPIIFVVNDFEKFGIYNNIKGKIIDIIVNDDQYTFKIELEKNINVTNKVNSEISIDSEGKNTIVSVFKNVTSFDDYDNELNVRSKLPFQLAYAMSIHKAQGLEFEKVKIIITEDTEDHISKNVFYTAITRAKKHLEIYWDPEVSKIIFQNLVKESKSSKVDIEVFKNLISLKKINI